MTRGYSRIDKTERRHHAFVMDYARHPSKFGLDSSSIEGVIVEPIWYRSRGGIYTRNMESLCDIIYLLKDKGAVPMEVKSNRKSKRKAYDQIIHGKDYCNKVLERYVDQGLIAYYGSKKLGFDTYEL